MKCIPICKHAYLEPIVPKNSSLTKMFVIFSIMGNFSITLKTLQLLHCLTYSKKRVHISYQWFIKYEIVCYECHSTLYIRYYKYVFNFILTHIIVRTSVVSSRSKVDIKGIISFKGLVYFIRGFRLFQKRILANFLGECSHLVGFIALIIFSPFWQQFKIIF